MRHLTALLFAILGLFATVVVVIAINEAPPLKKRDLATQQVSFSTPPPPKTIAPKPKPKAKPKSSSAPPPVPLVMTGAGGLSFGLEGLDDIFDTSTSLVLSNVDNIVMTSETVDVPPKATRRLSPDYPSGARRKGIEGYVTLSLLVTETGHVEDVVVLDSYPEGIFDTSATEIVTQWEFVPGEYDNQPVPVRVTQTLRYSLG
jgi:protein TonB